MKIHAEYIFENNLCRQIAILVVAIIAIFNMLPVQAQDFYYPDSSFPDDTPIERTSFQKGIGISTDVIAIVMPAATLTGVLLNKDRQGVKQGVFTALATAGSVLILKYSVRELRPDHSNYHSFPSGHSATTFATAAFLQRRYGWKFGGPAYALATYTAVGRVLAKKHHWWDVVAGAAIGAGSAYIFTRPWARKHDFSLAPVATETAIGFTASMSF